ncbi:MAG: cyclase family protein [Candidatus Dormibacteria bacterium]
MSSEPPSDTAASRVASAWGRWGADDEAGAINLIREDQVLSAAALVVSGQVVRLGRALGPKTPVAPHRKRPERFMTRDGGDYAANARRPGGFQFAEEVVAFAPHSGTHIDALSHAWYEDQLYNGFSSNLIRSTAGAQRCGAEKLPPIATRGVLLDLAAGASEPPQHGQAFGAKDLQRAALDAGVKLQPGDAVLLHTGWLGRAGEDGTRYFGGEPGIDLGAAEWLAEAGVAVVGADNYAVEVQPSAPGTAFPVHQFLLRDQGVPLIEDMVLGQLVGRGRPTFFFVAVPLPLVGSTAGPVCPIAIL